MAQEPSAKADVIDIDELEVEILVIAKSTTMVQPAASFLSRRGWPTESVTNISKAIELIAEHRPDFVLISFNHPSPTIVRLPELIAQTFNITCIGFVESSDSGSTQKLNQIKIRHKIFGQPSGPNFHRGIRRILAEKFNVRLDERSSEEVGKVRAVKGNVRIRGNKEKEGPGTQLFGEDRHEGFGSIISGTNKSGQSDQASNGLSAATRGEMIYQSGTSREKLLANSAVDSQPLNSALQSNEHGDSLSGFADSGLSAEEIAALKDAIDNPDVEETSYSEGSHQLPSSEDKGSNDSVSSGKYTMARKRKSLKEVAGSTAMADTAGNLLFGKKVDHASDNSAASSAQDVASPSATHLADLLKKSLFGESGVEVLEKEKPQSLLEKAVEETFNQICNRNPDIEPLALHLVKRVGVFPVDSPDLPGYLVMAIESGDGDEQEKFLRTAEKALQAAFMTAGLSGKLEDGFWLGMPDVNFQNWVQFAAVFNFKMDHSGSELGVAFFSNGKPLPKPRIVPDGDMYTIELEAISTEQPVNFKVYLHLQKNNKYFLYLRNGRRLQPEQKGRLQEGRIREIFMKSVDIENLRIFLAGAYLKGTLKGQSAA